MIRSLRHFYRNARSGELLELFLVSAVSSLLITRFVLHLAHYPSLGGRGLHIAHMLWGGLLMATAIIMLLAFMGFRVQRRASVIAGLGFGLFIDELGKFITQDNNYFFQPTIGIIYLVFVSLFIISRSLSQNRHLSPHENLLNAVAMTEEVVIDDLDEVERKQALDYLKRANQNHPLVPALTQVLSQVSALPASHTPWRRWARSTQQLYERIIAHPRGAIIFTSAFVLNAIAYVVVVVVLLYMELHGAINGESIMELVSAMISPALVFIGLVRGRSDRLVRYRWFSIALLINMFVTQFFSFYHDQFSALPGFITNLLFYIGVRSLIKHEERMRLSKHD